MSTQISASKNQVIRFKNKPVITTAQLAGFYGVSQKNILDKQNFDLQNEQKERITKIEKKEVENINEIKD